MKQHCLKNIIITIFVLLLFNKSYSQRNEIGGFVGVSYYLGDLNPSIQFLLPHPAVSFLYRYNFNPRFAYKLFIAYATVSGSDAASHFDVERNLSFKSPIAELSNQIELNFMKYVPGNLNYPFSPYIFTGFSVFYFNPMAEYNGKWYSLKPLGTEGQGTTAYPGSHKYPLVSTALPFGVGFKLNLSKAVGIGLEWGMRKTSTDYIDDVGSGVDVSPKNSAAEWTYGAYSC